LIAIENGDGGVDGLFVAEMDTGEEPPHGGLEPEKGSEDLLAEAPEPVSAEGVFEFVEDGEVAQGAVGPIAGEEDDRGAPAEAGRRAEAIDEAHFNGRLEAFDGDGFALAAPAAEAEEAEG